MNACRFWAVVLASRAVLGAALAAEPRPMIPVTTPPITYVIDYTGDYFTKPDHIGQFKAAPPDLLHIGKATPITHLWGPIRLYCHENQYTGGPGHTLSWENIALISPEAVAERVENLRRTLKRYHAIGIPEIAPYISFHTLAGDHQKRLGFWKFYDQWEKYSKWAGPRPPHDPFDWLVVDIKGKFVGGSCGGYSPAYFAPLHRYRACMNHPDWAEWHRRLIRMVADVGYDGCFVDNTSPDPCYCRYCKARFGEFLEAGRNVDWVRRLTDGLPLSRLKLDSPDVPAELVRRWRLIRTRDHLGMLREVGRRVTPGFTIFPNSGRIRDCLLIGDRCDRLMFESTASPGLLDVDNPAPAGQIAIAVSADPVEPNRIRHRYEIRDRAAWREMQAEISIPTAARVGQPVSLEVKILSVGDSLSDGDAAEDFQLVLWQTETGEEIRVGLEPRVAVGGTHSSRKPKQPPVVLKGVWKPRRAGTYTVDFGYRYTDDGHIEEARLRPHLDRLLAIPSCRTHLAELLFAQHMRARCIYLGYEGRKKGQENVQELSLAELAAFSGGGGFSGRGGPQAKYRAFCKKHGELFDGWRQFAPAAVLYAHWGPNPLATRQATDHPAIQAYLGSTHRPFVALVDAYLPEAADALAGFRVVYLQSPRYEMSPAQLEALEDYVDRGGCVVLGGAKVTINGQSAAERFELGPQQAVRARGRGKVALWNWRKPATPTRPLGPTDGRRGNLRFATYRKGDRLAVHVVNYNLRLSEKAKGVLGVEATPLEVQLPSGWAAVKATGFNPDAQPQRLSCAVADRTARLTLPKTHVYQIVLLEKE